MDPDEDLSSELRRVARLALDAEGFGKARRHRARRAIDNLGANAVGPLVRALAEVWPISGVPTVGACTARVWRRLRHAGLWILRIINHPLPPLLVGIAIAVDLRSPPLLKAVALFVGISYCLMRFVEPYRAGFDRLSPYEDPHCRHALKMALIRRLNHVHPEDVHILSNGDRVALLHILTDACYLHSGQFDQEIAVAILRVLPEFGDHKALEFVESILQIGETEPFDRPDWKWHKILEAARECAPSLRAFIELEHSRASLLHPAEPPSEALLRPASATAEDHMELLVRPSSSSET
jgi:hypothetical protein